MMLAMLAAVTLTGCVLVEEGPYGSTKSAGGDVVLCHKGKQTMTLPREAATAHINHGDRYGAC